MEHMEHIEHVFSDCLRGLMDRRQWKAVPLSVRYSGTALWVSCSSSRLRPILQVTFVLSMWGHEVFGDATRRPNLADNDEAAL